MTRRIQMLEAEQLAAMAPHARERVGRALATGAVRWSRWESAVRACYQYEGVRWPATGGVDHLAATCPTACGPREAATRVDAAARAAERAAGRGWRRVAD